MRKMNTTTGTWEIIGVNLLPSDSLYLKLKECVEKDHLDISYLQKATGHMAPIKVDKKNRQIIFSCF